MLLLSFIARALLFIELIIETILRSWICGFANIIYRILHVIIINWTRNLLQLSWVGKITFLSIPHCNFLKIIGFRFKCFQTFWQSSIQMRHLFLNTCHTGWQMEALKFTNWKILIWIVPIWLRWIFRCCWRWSTLEINCSSWEPCQLCPGLHRPVGLISFWCFYDFLACHLW